jgi:hypothetical protein
LRGVNTILCATSLPHILRGEKQSELQSRRTSQPVRSQPQTANAKLLMYLGAKMKLDLRVICSFGIEEPFALRKVDEMTIFVLRNI